MELVTALPACTREALSQQLAKNLFYTQNPRLGKPVCVRYVESRQDCPQGRVQATTCKNIVRPCGVCLVAQVPSLAGLDWFHFRLPGTAVPGSPIPPLRDWCTGGLKLLHRSQERACWEPGSPRGMTIHRRMVAQRNRCQADSGRAIWARGRGLHSVDAVPRQRKRGSREEWDRKENGI